MNDLKLKLSFITGLKEIALNEISLYTKLRIIKEDADSIYLDFIQDLTEIKNLRSVSQAYIIIENPKYNPLYISNHKSILSDLIEMVVSKNKEVFKSFKITCAGSDSPEVRSIAKYVGENWGLIEKEEADLKIHMIKHDDIWEIGIQITPRPLSVRAYKVRNMSGAMDPTIAYALNSLCGLDQAESYLNIFSGSATLLIEAGQCYPNLKKLIGFDNNKKHISLAIQNIKKAGLIQKIELKEKDIADKPDLGKFDVITSDLPFGMSISKDEDLDKLYQCFIEYCEQFLNHAGMLAVYTSEHEMLEKIIRRSRFKIIKTLELKFITAVDAYLRPKIFVCKLK
ncbi:methyltransferase domain-containing protein [Patescibacteria group bacterium]|nr:methyltransferase domain-containing protein [Patescibacteria group bacterium]